MRDTGPIFAKDGQADAKSIAGAQSRINPGFERRLPVQIGRQVIRVEQVSVQCSRRPMACIAPLLKVFNSDSAAAPAPLSAASSSIGPRAWRAVSRSSKSGIGSSGVIVVIFTGQPSQSAGIASSSSICPFRMRAWIVMVIDLEAGDPPNTGAFYHNANRRSSGVSSGNDDQPNSR